MQKVLNETQLEEIYNWVDQIPLSRPKRNMPRDFSDAVLLAEIVAYFHPKSIEIHNYIATGSIAQKVNNWKLLNQKVFKKMKIILEKDDIHSLANAEPNHIEKILFLVRKYISEDANAPSVSSKLSKASKFTIGLKKQEKKPKVFTLKQAKKIKEVAELLDAKDKSVDLLKEQIELLSLKFNKLEEILKSKDKQIEGLVTKIRTKGLA